METNTSYVKNEPTVGMNFFENIPPVGVERNEKKTDLIGLTKLKCPYCGKNLNDDEYEHAIKEFERKAAHDYKAQNEKLRRTYEEQISQERKIFQEKIGNLTKIQTEQTQLLKNELKMSYMKQVEDLKKNYDTLDIQRQEYNKKILEKNIAEYERQAAERQSQITQLQNKLNTIKENAFEQARSIFQKELRAKDIEIEERDIQIQRCKVDIEKLKQELTKTQPELKGEAGEVDLMNALMQKFPEDHFSRQTRGISEGDIIQHIRTSTGLLLKIPIIYDNKEVVTISKKELEKQKYYKEQEGTDYLLIVSPNLPKSIKNGIIGKKEGIILVRRDIVAEIAEQIRGAIIEICKNIESKTDMETKQSRIYEYITGREFCRKMESISKINMDLTTLQQKEEEEHKRLWKKRNTLLCQSRDVYIDITGGIDTVIHCQYPSGS